MSIDFSKVTGWSTKRGNLVQVADSAGRVIWAVSGGDTAILEVEKITATTYAGETSFANEVFIMLDIYPKTNSTVSVTYGGLTKTITDTSGAAEPNAQQVFFGTFNGVSDSVTTPSNGELTIEGDYYAFGCGAYQSGSKSYNTSYCSCITAVKKWGEIEKIPDGAFNKCSSLVLTSLPSGITSIGVGAFYYCHNIEINEIPEGVTTIWTQAFCMNNTDTTKYEGVANTKIKNVVLPSTLTSIYGSAFMYPEKYAQDSVTGEIETRLQPYLETVTLLSTTPPTIEGTNYLIALQIIVPKGCGAIYKAAEGWKSVANYIMEAS